MGDVDADYPGMMLESSRRGSMSFVIGTGSANVEIETFSGQVRIYERNR